MLILTQNKENPLKGYHGTVGEPTNMYDFKGEKLYVGDIVAFITNDNQPMIGIEPVVSLNSKIANFGSDGAYVQGLKSVFDSEHFENFPESPEEADLTEEESEQFWERLYGLTEQWAITKVKSFAQLVVGERLVGDFPCYVAEVDSLEPEPEEFKNPF